LTLAEVAEGHKLKEPAEQSLRAVAEEEQQPRVEVGAASGRQWWPEVLMKPR
jgi:hypothetical protein